MNELTLTNIEPVTPIMQEEFRRIHTSLDFSLTDKHIVCFTSTVPNEGKSTLSFNIARSIAESGLKVLFIDADMRNSNFAEIYGYEKEIAGLSHILAGKVRAEDGIYKTNIDRLYLMPTGVFSRNPARLFRSKNFERLLEVSSGVFDYIIIDTPPVSAVTDAEIIANLCSGTVLIVSSNMNHRAAVKDSIEKITNATENFLGVILNRADLMGKSYGGYGKYGKYGRYGKYGSYGYGIYGSKKGGK